MKLSLYPILSLLLLANGKTTTLAKESPLLDIFSDVQVDVVEEVESVAEASTNDENEAETEAESTTEATSDPTSPDFKSSPEQLEQAAASTTADVEQPAGNASIFGQVVDAETGSPVSGVTVIVDGTNILATTDAEGKYTLDKLKPGTYDVVFSKSGYRNSRIKQITIVENQPFQANFPLPELPPEASDEVFDLGEFEVTAEEAREFILNLDTIINSKNLLSILSAEDFSKYGASDVGDAIKRVSGVTVAEGKYAVIRGLGDRYVATTLNGLPIASPDPDRLAVQLDLFPTSLVSSLEVTKTYTPDQPGNSTGGVNMIVNAVPNDFFLNVSIGGGFKSEVHGNQSFLQNDRATSLDRIAHGASDRALQGALRGPFPDVDDLSKTINDALAATLPSVFISQADYDAVVAEFNSLADQLGRANHAYRKDPEIDHNFKLGLGDAYDIGNNIRLGYKIGLNYSRKSEFIDDAYFFNSYIEPGGSLPFTPNNFINPSVATGYHKAKASESTVTSVLAESASFGVELGQDHAINLTFLDLNISEDKSFRTEAAQPGGNYGRYYDQPFRQNWDPTYGTPDYDTNGDGTPDAVGKTDYQIDERLYYVERSLETLQLNGNHAASVDDWIFGDFLAEWAVSFDNATQEEPGYLQSRGIVENLDGDLTLSTNSTSFSSVEPSFIIWRNVEDEKKTYKGDFTIEGILTEGFESKLKFGLLISESDRTVLDEYLELEYFSSTVPASNNPDGAPLENYDDFFPTAFATAADIALNTESNGNYIMLEQQLFSNLRLIGGVRFENNSADVKVAGTPLLRGAGFDNPFDNLPLTGGYDENALLPAVSLIWKLFDDSLTLRAAYSETIALPSGREVSPYASSSFLDSSIEVGNSTLTPSDVENCDVGLTYTLDNGDYLTLNLFRKNISNRIERIAGLGADSSNSDDYDDYNIFAFSQSLGAGIYSWYNNPNEAKLQGIEIEVRKNLGFISLDDISMGINYTYIDGNVNRLPIEVAAKVKSDVLTSTDSIESYRERDLTGQPSQIFNADITYNNDAWGLRASVIVNYVSDVLFGTSLANSYDVYTKGHAQLDFTLSKEISEHFKFGLSIKNITDSRRVTYYQSVEETASGLSYGTIERTAYKLGPAFSFSLSYTY